MKKAVTAIAAVLLLTCLVQADGYIKQKQHTDAFQMMGQAQPARDEVSEQWIGDNQVAMVNSNRTLIVDVGKNAVFIVNHRAKTYVQMDLPLDFSKYMPEGMGQMMGNTTVTITPNGQTQQVGEFKCDGYDMTMSMMGMMTINSKIWASTDVAIDWKSFSEKMLPLVTQATLRLNDESVKEFSKIKGLQILNESTMEMMGTQIKTSTTVLEVAKKPAPAGIYEVPAGYTKKDQFSPQEMMQ